MIDIADEEFYKGKVLGFSTGSVICGFGFCEGCGPNGLLV